VANRQLTSNELKELAAPLLGSIRKRLAVAAKGDKGLLWALRRKVFKELMYDERSKPMQRRALKKKKWIEQNGRCKTCRKRLPEKGSVLDRLKAMDGYTAQNTRLLCPKCDVILQTDRGYK